jgi:hypothetical protein
MLMCSFHVYRTGTASCRHNSVIVFFVAVPEVRTRKESKLKLSSFFRNAFRRQPGKLGDIEWIRYASSFRRKRLQQLLMGLDPGAGLGVVLIFRQEGGAQRAHFLSRTLIPHGRTSATAIAEISARMWVALISLGVLIAGLSTSATFGWCDIAHSFHSHDFRSIDLGEDTG